MKNLFLICVVGCLGLAGCTEKADPVTVHEGDRRTPQVATGTQNSDSIEPKVVVESLDELASKVLSSERILDPRSLLRRDVMDELIVFNRQLLRTPVAERSQSRFQKILERYFEALKVGCGDFSSSCSSAQYFRLAGNSEAVLKLIIQQRPEWAGTVLPFALKLKPVQPDPELLLMTLIHGPEMIAVAPPGPQRVALQSLIDSALLAVETSPLDISVMRSLLTNIHAWDLVLARAVSGGSTTEGLIRMIAKSRLVYGDDGNLHPDLKRWMERAQSQPGSLTSMQRKIRESGHFNPEAIGATPLEKQDELFFLVDSVFENRLTPDQAAELYRHLGRSASDLADVLENYLRLRFSMSLFASTGKAVEVFTTPGPTATLLWHAIDSAQQINAPWVQLEGRLPSLKSFVTKSLKGHPEKGAEDRATKLIRTIESYPESVKVTSVYPNTLLLFYLLSQKEFKLTVRGLGTIDTGDLMNLLFQGLIPPLLGYVEDSRPYNSFSLLYSFDMAVRSGLIASAGIDVDDFIAVTVKRLMENPIRFVSKNLDTIENRFRESSRMTDLRRACSELRGGVPYSRTIDLGEVRRSPYYGDLIDDAFKGMTSVGSVSGGDPGAIGKYDMGLNFIDSDYAETVERLRLNLVNFERIGQAMLTSYADYLTRFEKLSAQQVQDRTVKTRQQLERIESLRARFFKSSADLIADLGDCYTRIAIEDFRYTSEAIEYEEMYLRQVHRDLTKLRAGVSDLEKAQIEAKYRFQGLPSGFEGRDRLSEDGYLVNQIDFLIRAAGYLQRGIKTERDQRPALAPQLTINMGAKLDIDSPILAKSVSKFVPFHENENEFVASALRNIFSQVNAFAFWQNLVAGRILSWTHYLKSYSSIYRLEFWQTNGSPQLISPENILETHRQMLKLVSFTPKERRLMEILAMPYRYETLFFDNRLLNFTRSQTSGYAVQDYWGLFDLPVRVMSYEKLGYDYDLAQVESGDLRGNPVDKRSGFWQLGQEYYSVRAQENRAETMIPFNPALDQMLDLSMRRFVQSEIGAITAFNRYTLGYTERMAALPEEERPAVDLKLNQRMTGPMVTESLIDNMPARVLRFDQTTAGCLTSSKCPQFD